MRSPLESRRSPDRPESQSRRTERPEPDDDVPGIDDDVEDDEGGDGDCGVVRETAAAEARLWGFFGGDTYSYATRTEDPCRITLDLAGPSDADFDLYVTTDGRTPTTDDFDAKSDSATADEEVVLEDVDSDAQVGILIDPAFGYGRYRIAVEELGR